MLLLGATVIAPVCAQDLTGSVTMGWREVSVSGSRPKYDEDINLPSGPRLVDASMRLEASDRDDQWPDLVAIDVSNLGAEPYENLRLEIREFGAYRFRAERRRSDYFYDDILVLPENASITGSTGGDFHRFDFERVRDDVSLDIDLNSRARLALGIERFEKEGSSTTTLDVQRDEFELDKPIDETMQVWRVALDYRWDNVALTVQERVSDFENRSELFLPGFSVGENSGDLTTLDFFFLDQPYDYRSYEHTVRITATPIPRLQLAFGTVASELELDAAASERSQGVDFTGAPFVTDVAGAGGIDRDLLLFDVDATYTVSDRLQLTAGARRYRLDQAGRLPFGDDQGGQSSWDIDNTGYEFGALFAATPAVTVSAGWRGERRDVDVSLTPQMMTTSSESRDTDSDGFYVSLDYRPRNNLALTASIDDANLNDPYSLASPTRSTRYRLRGRYRLDNGLLITASHSRSKRDNDTSQWADDNEQSDLRLSYTGERLMLSVGASVVDLSRDFERLVTGGSRQDLFSVAYAADTSFIDAAASYRLRDTVTIGGNYRAYDNDGSFDVKRDDALGFVELGLSRRYTARLSYRYLNYAEGGIESYDADIVELSLNFGF